MWYISLLLLLLFENPLGDVADVGRLADILECEVAYLSVMYLGLPLGASYKSTRIWDEVIEKVEKRLAS
jgi:hypothetical protein